MHSQHRLPRFVIFLFVYPCPITKGFSFHFGSLVRSFVPLNDFVFLLFSFVFLVEILICFSNFTPTVLNFVCRYLLLEHVHDPKYCTEKEKKNKKKAVAISYNIMHCHHLFIYGHTKCINVDFLSFLVFSSPSSQRCPSLHTYRVCCNSVLIRKENQNKKDEQKEQRERERETWWRATSK